jgi:hypothetical protein
LTYVLVLFMATPPEMRERQARILAELSELGLALARDLQACALAADQASEKAELSLAFHRTSRSVRQSLALEAKFERDHQAAQREDGEVAKRAATFHVEKRKALVKLVVERCVWSEADGEEAEKLLSDLDDILELDALSGTFAGDDAIEAHVARICAQLGVDTPEAFAARRADEPSPTAASDATPEPRAAGPPIGRRSG